MGAIFKIFEERDKMKQEILKLKNDNNQLKEVIDQKDIKICELNTKLIRAEKKLDNIKKWSGIE